MGQSASKGLSKAAERVAKRAVEQRPPIPSRNPVPGGGGASTTTSGGGGGGGGPTAANPANFLRGEGIAKQDVRDIGQEMYLQHVQQRQQEQKDDDDDRNATASSVPTDSKGDNSGPATATANDNNAEMTRQSSPTPPTPPPPSQQQDMPADLLRFIQDVGPAKKAVDTDQTAPRLLQDENKDELVRGESSRRASRRRRVQMPLITGLDATATTTTTNTGSNDDDATEDVSAALMTQKNTNFAGFDEHDTDNGVGNNVKEDEEYSNRDMRLSLDVVELYKFLQSSSTDVSTVDGTSDKTVDKIVDEYYERKLDDSSGTKPTESEQEQQKQLLVQTLNVLEVPTLRMDSDYNILGLYSADVPGPEVRSVSTIPEDKIMLVLKDLDVNAEQPSSIGAGVDGEINRGSITSVESEKVSSTSTTTSSSTAITRSSLSKDTSVDDRAYRSDSTNDNAIRKLAERRKERKAKMMKDDEQ